MATSGTPTQGLDNVIADRVYINGADLTLVAYTNTADSLNQATVYADLIQPTAANGYAPILLNGTWSSSGGIVTYEHSVNNAAGQPFPEWTASGTWSAPVTGVAIVNGTSHIAHFKDLSAPFVAATGKKLTVDLASVVV